MTAQDLAAARRGSAGNYNSAVAEECYAVDMAPVVPGTRMDCRNWKAQLSALETLHRTVVGLVAERVAAVANAEVVLRSHPTRRKDWLTRLQRVRYRN